MMGSLLAQNSSTNTVKLSPVPLYPLDKIIPAELSNERVFLDPETWDLIGSLPLAEANGIMVGEDRFARKEFHIKRANHVGPEVSELFSKKSREVYQFLCWNFEIEGLDFVSATLPRPRRRISNRYFIYDAL
jgi:hypothetical protein